MNHRYVRSLGHPYFAFQTVPMGDRDHIPGGGITRLAARFRVDALPQQLASADELHPIISFIHSLPTQPTIMAVGITPNGRMKATNIAGDVIQTSASTIADTTRWYELSVSYDNTADPASRWTLTLDGSTAVGAGAYGLPLLPNSGYETHFLLFNGMDGISRGSISMSMAEVEFRGVQPNIYRYSFGEREGPMTTPEKIVASGAFEVAASGVATALFYDPLILQPWGNVPGGSASEAYRWGLDTDYSRLPKPVTAYSRVTE